AIQRLYWYGPRNFEPWSDEEDDTSPGTSLPKLPQSSSGIYLIHARYSVQQVQKQKKSGSSVESGFEPKTFWLWSSGLTTRLARPPTDNNKKVSKNILILVY
ncbi:hypothetical protein AVEN_123567-1, partial [Araneus ventricosus]